MIKITGLDKLSRQIEDATKALESLDGKLTNVSFDPSDPGSIEIAIQQVNTVIDERVAPYADNPFVASLAENMKAKYRDMIIDKAAAERLKGNVSDE